MAKLNHEWIVQPHGRVVTVTDGILTVEGSIAMPLGNFPRRMTILVLRDGGTAVWSAISLDETGMRRIEQFGPVRFLIVPNAGHRLDVAAWKHRYPQAQVIAPAGARSAVNEATGVDATHDAIEDPDITFHLVQGTKADEFALTIRREDGITLVLNDMLSNVRHPKGLGANVMARLFGFGVSRPRTSWPVKRMYVSDPARVAEQFRSWAAIPDLRRVVVSHGEIIERDAKAVLERAAEDFD